MEDQLQNNVHYWKKFYTLNKKKNMWSQDQMYNPSLKQLLNESMNLCDKKFAISIVQNPV